MAEFYTVDLPKADGTWEEDETFDTEEEAIAYVKERYGADDEGRIFLVTGPHDGGSDDDEMLDDEDIYNEDESDD